MAAPLLPVAINWPNIAACYGWLSLDRRGNWRLKGEPVRHAGLISFINKHYAPDSAGNWIFQNGPQTVYVALEYTPLVYRMNLDDCPTAHTGASAGPVTDAYIDDEGSALLVTALGIGLLDDRDLTAFLACCVDEDGTPATEDDLLAAMAGHSKVSWRGIRVQTIARRVIPSRFGFQGDPAP